MTSPTSSAKKNENSHETSMVTFALDFTLSL